MRAHGRTVLIVDGDPEFRGFMELLLAAEGYDPRSVATVEEADREITRRRPDLVIADVILPGAPPFAVLDRLAAAPDSRTVPALLCTGDIETLRQGSARLRRDWTGVALKPFDIDAVLRCVAWLVAGASEPAEHIALRADLER